MSPRDHSVFLCVADVRAADDTCDSFSSLAGEGAHHDAGTKNTGIRGTAPQSAALSVAGPAAAPALDSLPALLHREIRLRVPSAAVHSCAGLTELHAALCRVAPDTIVLDESVFLGGDVESLLAALAQSAPIVLIGSEHSALMGLENIQSHPAPLIAAGRADFVFRRGNFPVLVAALVERAVRNAETVQASLESGLRDLSEEALEVLRHEINNPLTGILGNAEILLASRRHQLPPDSVQRLQTIVELAVRLREYVLRVSRELPLARRAASR
jgi:signal transduction histidine kinase